MIKLPVRVVEDAVNLLRQVSEDRPLTPRLKRKLSQVAAELEVRVKLADDGQVRISKKLTLLVLRGMAILVHFHGEIKEVASVLIGIKDR